MLLQSLAVAVTVTEGLPSGEIKKLIGRDVSEGE